MSRLNHLLAVNFVGSLHPLNLSRNEKVVSYQYGHYFHSYLYNCSEMENIVKETSRLKEKKQGGLLSIQSNL